MGGSRSLPPAIGAGMVRNAAGNMTARLVTLVATFLATPVLVHGLGPTDYGLWVLLASIAGYGWLLDLGIGSGVIKLVAEHSARGELEAARRTVSSAFWLYTALGLLACLLGVLAGLMVGEVFRLPLDQRPMAGWLTVLMAASIAISLAFSPITAILRGLERFGEANLITAGGLLAGLAANVLVVAAGGGLPALLATGFGVTLVWQACGVWVLRRTAPDLAIRPRRPDRAAARRLLGFSGPVFALQIAGRLQFETDVLVLAVFLPVSAVTPYALAQRLAGLASAAAEQFTRVILPVASRLSSQDAPEVLRSLYLFATRLTLGLLMPPAVVLLTLGRPVLGLWVGPAFEGASDVLAILTIAVVVDTCLWPAGYVLQGMGRHRPLAVIALASGLANLALSIVLVQVVGVVGVALGTLIPTSLEAGCFVIPLATRELGLRPGRLFREAFLPGLLPALPAWLVMSVAAASLPPASPLVLLAIAAAGGVAYVAAYLALGATQLERRLGLDLLRRLRPRASG